MIEATASSTAGIITASATLFIAIAGVIAALTTFIPVLRIVRKTEGTVDEVHVMVNQQHTDSLRYQQALKAVLKEHGIDIPVDQSLPAVDPL